MVATDARPAADGPPPGGGTGRRRGSVRTVAIVAGLVGVVIALLVVLLATRDPVGEKQATSQLIGQRAPELGGDAVIGEKVQTGSGRWTVVNFFASWCVPCIKEHPELRQFQEEHVAANDATVVSVIAGDTPANARKFFDQRGGEWPVLTDPEGRTALDYGLVKLPETYLVSPTGIVVTKFNGQVTAAALNQVIDEVTRAADTTDGTTAGTGAGS